MTEFLTIYLSLNSPINASPQWTEPDNTYYNFIGLVYHPLGRNFNTQYIDDSFFHLLCRSRANLVLLLLI